MCFRYLHPFLNAFVLVVWLGLPIARAGSGSLSSGLCERKFRAANFLHKEFNANPPSVIAGDVQFNTAIPLGRLRQYLSERFNFDLGYDMGIEVFSSSLTLHFFSLLPSETPERTLLFGHVPNLLSTVKGGQRNGRYRFFLDERSAFASDTDSTGVAASALYENGFLSRQEILQIGRELLESAAPRSISAERNVDADGKSNGDLFEKVIMVYWDDSKEPGTLLRGYKHDPAAAANALYALKLAQREGLKNAEEVIRRTQDYIVHHLVSGNYRQGTRYYPSPDVFLYFTSRLVATYPELRPALSDALRRAIAERNNLPAQGATAHDPLNALNLAFRILAAKNVGGMDMSEQKAYLIGLQQADGSWSCLPFYSQGRLQLYFGSAALTTVAALAALSS